MRFSQLFLFVRFLGASGLGTSLGLAVGGLITVVIGQALAPGSDWLAGLPGFLVLGAGVGAFTAWASRGWFLPATSAQPRMGRRVASFAAAGTVVVPLVVAVGESHGIAPLVLGLAVAGWVPVLTMWVRAHRRTLRRARRAVAPLSGVTARRA